MPDRVREMLGSHAGWISAVVVAIAVRGAIVVLAPDMTLFGDEHDYLRGARQWLRGDEVGVFPFRPPLYLFFVAGVLHFAPSPEAVRLLQAGVEGACVGGMYWLARDVAGRRAGLFAAWGFALYPDFVFFSHTLWSESITVALLVATLVALRRLARGPDAVGAIAAGVLLGALCLVKPYHLYLAPLLLGATAFAARPDGRTGAVRAAAIAFATLAVCVVPWSLHASAKYGRIVLVSTTGELNLRDGTNYYSPPQYDFPLPQRVPERLVSTLGRKEGLVAFVARNPGLFLQRAAEKMGYLWSPNSFAIRSLYTGKYGPPGDLPGFVRVGAAWLVMTSTALVLLLALPGFFASRDRGMQMLCLAYVVPYTAMITITPALSRYRLPMMVFAVLYAACFVAGGRAQWSALGRRSVWVPAAALAAALFAAWTARVPEVVRALW